jgi:hypothetical protein
MMKTFTVETMKRLSHYFGAVLILSLVVQTAAFSQGTAPPLGTSANFGVLAQAAISGKATITGDVGTLSGAIGDNITAPGYTVYSINHLVVQKAISDLNTAYLDALGQTGGTTLPGGTLSGTLTPGVYILSAATPNLSESVTLNGEGDANAVFIFQASSTLITAASSSIILTNGTVWNNVYWQVGSSATLGAGSDFNGTLLVNTSITVGNSASVTGRLLAGAVTATGAVSMDEVTVLPVELMTFTVAAHQMNAVLNWSTATELNNYGFDIERRGENDGLFTRIGFVEGNGTTNVPREYSFTDNYLSPGTYSYRLKQIDRDGMFSYSHAVEVIAGRTDNSFSLTQNYPNPFNPATTIEYNIETPSHVSLKIYNLIGDELATLVNSRQDAGSYVVSFNTSKGMYKFPSGVYFYRLQAGTSISTKRLILMK